MTSFATASSVAAASATAVTTAVTTTTVAALAGTPGPRVKYNTDRRVKYNTDLPTSRSADDYGEWKYAPDLDVGGGYESGRGGRVV